MQPKEITLPYKFEPRWYQLPILAALDKGYKKVVACLHRGAGKDLMCLNYLIKKAFEEPGVYLHCFPNYSQGKRAIWTSVHDTHEGESMGYLDHIPPELIRSKNGSEMMIQFINGSVYCVMGLDGKNAQRARGMNPRFVILSEYAYMDPSAWYTIEPRISQNKGTAIFLSTPNGQNHFYSLYNHAKATPEEYYAALLTIEDTKCLDENHINHLRKEGIPEDFIQQEYYCFPPGQFVMTSEGMKDIKDIEPGMLVMSHTGRFRKVLETYERDYEGDLIRINSYGSGEDLLCTPNHPLRVYERHKQSFRWIEAAHIKEKYRLFFPKFSFHGEYFSESFLKMMAWYICEGSSGLNHLQFTLRDHKEAEHVSKICKESGYETTIRKAETSINLIINDTNLLDTLKILCGNDAQSKKIPLHLIGKHAEMFFYELMKGDGCTHINKGQPRINFTTISKTLAYQVQILANSIGLTAGITARKSYDGEICGRKVKCKRSYQVQIGSVEIRQESTTLIRGKYGIGASVRRVSTEPYSGKVYNFKVQFDESYVVNGRAVHNCSFTRGAEGSYYGKLIQQARDDDRMGKLPIIPDLPCHTSWDIGIGDASAIWIFQSLNNGTYNFLHYYENQGEGLQHYIDYLESWKRKNRTRWGTHFVPHDMANREFTSGVDRLHSAREMGIDMTVLAKKPLPEGIQAVRSIIPLCSFDGKECKRGVQCLDFYRKKYNDALKVYYDDPVHDQWSHGADAFRMAAIGIKSVGFRSAPVEDTFKAAAKYFGG